MKTALVVDDSRAVRILLAKTLHECGYHVLDAVDGSEALEVVAKQKQHIELVLADWYMPNLNGLQLVQSLRSDPVNESMIILMVTSESDQDQMMAALMAGANEYVMKPFTREILIEKLQLLGAANGGGQ